MDLDNLSLSPASFKKRFLASIIDVFFPLFIGILPAAGVTYSITGPLNFKMYYLYIFLAIFYFAIHFANVIVYQTKTGRSLGKLLLGLKICYPNHKVDVRKEDIIKREVGKLFTLATAGYSFFQKYKEEEILTFHDEYSKTVVLVLPEDHEEYLYEYHYEEYFTSDEEDEEYNKIKQEKAELEKIEREREKQEREYQKQLKKEQSQQEKSSKENTVASLPTAPTAIPATQPMESVPLAPTNTIPSMNEDTVFNDGEGINIIGSGFDTTQNANSKTKIKSLFAKKNSQPMENVNYDESAYVNPKLSGLVQDNTYLPSENIYSEIYKGWNIREVHQTDVQTILNKSKKAI